MVAPEMVVMVGMVVTVEMVGLEEQDNVVVIVIEDVVDKVDKVEMVQKEGEGKMEQMVFLYKWLLMVFLALPQLLFLQILT
jgi:hypothetical protein